MVLMILNDVHIIVHGFEHLLMICILLLIVFTKCYAILNGFSPNFWELQTRSMAPPGSQGENPFGVRILAPGGIEITMWYSNSLHDTSGRPSYDPVGPPGPRRDPTGPRRPADFHRRPPVWAELDVPRSCLCQGLLRHRNGMQTWEDLVEGQACLGAGSAHA